MGDFTSTVVLKPRALVTADAAGLRAGLQATGFLPNFLAATEVGEGNELPMTTTMNAAGDVWRIKFEVPSPMPAIFVYPVAFSATLINDVGHAGFDDLFTDVGLFTISIGPTQDQFIREGWQDLVIGPTSLHGPSGFKTRSITPELKGFPVRARTPGGGADATVGEMLLTMKTPSALGQLATGIAIDYRLLFFPEGASDNAGFYQTQMFFHPR